MPITITFRPSNHHNFSHLNQGPERFVGELVARKGRKRVGWILLWSNKHSIRLGLPGIQVAYVEVLRTMRLRHIATRLYEAAAAFAWQEYGRPLISDSSLTTPARLFWMKQERLGRAVCLEHEKRSGSCIQFALATPPPANLD